MKSKQLNNHVPGVSKYFSVRELRGLEKAGNIITPGTHEFPSFSETGCIEYSDVIMANTHPDDVKGFKLLLTLFYFLPSFAIELILKIAEQDKYFPNPLGTLMRTICIGIKGVVLSLYYSNLGSQYGRREKAKVFDVIDYHVECTSDLAEQQN